VSKDYQLSRLIECYPSQLNQVFMNILANAIDAIAHTPQPQICIATQSCKDFAIITLSDNGPGMPDEIKDRIFDPFFTTKAVGKGTGMGLSISYQVVTEKHGGTISVSSSPEQGTQFTIRIPLAPKRPQKA
jgi:signal transduction histidine kinase